MATLAFIPVASAISGAATAGMTAGAAAFWGATITGGFMALGSYIDQTVIFPAIFKQSSPDGPRLDELKVQRATEGSPENFTIGRVRVGGTLIWASDLIETEND